MRRWQRRNVQANQDQTAGQDQTANQGQTVSKQNKQFFLFLFFASTTRYYNSC